LKIPRNRVLRGLLFGLHDLQNPWSAALVLWPGKRPIALRLANSPFNETFVIPAGQRRPFVRALARTVLGKDTSFVTAPSERAGGPVTPANGGGNGPPAWLPLLEHFLTGQYGWADCPATIRLRVEGLVGELRASLGDNLVGIYAHGSLATGCFNPRWSDIDLIGVTREPLDAGAKRSVAEAFLRYSRPPRGFEAMFVAEPRLRAWEFPTPFDFYFSEKLRGTLEVDLRSGAWRTWNGQGRMSNSLAAHVLVIRKRGLRLSGEPIDAVFPSIPDEDYLRAIMIDFESKKARIPATTISGVLNACRCYSYLLEHRLDDKEEAAVWALRVLPKKDRQIVRKVLDVYRGDRLLSERFDEREVARFFEDMGRRLDGLLSRGS
jgi:predicted nucleotidyltransferase